MFLKRPSPTNNSENISRRSAIAGVAFGITGGLLNSSLMGQTPANIGGRRRIFVVLAQPDATISYAAMDGTPGTPISGYLIACPQNCAKDQPGYAEANADATLKSIYLNTKEWIREIIFTDDPDEADPVKRKQNFKKYRQLLGSARVNDAPQAGGCGHISRSVKVTKVNLVSNVLQETPFSGVYSSLAIGTVKGKKYVADTIYIYQGDWQAPVGSPIKKAIDEIHSGVRPVGNSHC